MSSKPLKLYATPEELKLLRKGEGHVILLTAKYRGANGMSTTKPVFLTEAPRKKLRTTLGNGSPKNKT